MSHFSKMSKKLDEGWKLTSLNCDCKTNLLIFMENKHLYCPKCDRLIEEELEFIDEQEQNKQGTQQKAAVDSDEQDDQDGLQLDKETTNYFQNKINSDLSSKKMGQLLLSGWAMLEEVCQECCWPIMRSKAGEKICVNCPKVNIEPTPQQQSQQPKVEVPVQNQQQQSQIQTQQIQTININHTTLPIIKELDNVLTQCALSYLTIILEDLKSQNTEQLARILRSIEIVSKNQPKLKENTEFIGIVLSIIQQLSQLSSKLIQQRKFDQSEQIIGALITLKQII